MTITTSSEDFAPDYIIPPGETILDLLDERGMTQTGLARRLGVSPKHVNQIVRGSAPISPDVALGLEKVLGGSVSFWTTREALYQARLVAQAESYELEREVGWAQQFPIKELKARDLIAKSAQGAALVADLLRFLGIVASKAVGGSDGRLSQDTCLRKRQLRAISVVATGRDRSEPNRVPAV